MTFGSFYTSQQRLEAKIKHGGDFVDWNVLTVAVESEHGSGSCSELVMCFCRLRTRKPSKVSQGKRDQACGGDAGRRVVANLNFKGGRLACHSMLDFLGGVGVRVSSSSSPQTVSNYSTSASLPSNSWAPLEIWISIVLASEPSETKRERDLSLHSERERDG